MYKNNIWQSFEYSGVIIAILKAENVIFIGLGERLIVDYKFYFASSILSIIPGL